MSARVLLVEDNAADARLIAELLNEIPGRPFRLTTVGTLGAAFPFVAGHDVILLDLSLPDAYGLTTVERLVSAGRTLPIVVLTGNDDQQVAVDALKAGAQDYLLKSEMTSSLVARSLRYAIERKRVEAAELERAKSDRAAGRARFLAQVAAGATRTLELDAALPDLAAQLVPVLGDLALIEISGDEARPHSVAGARASQDGIQALPTAGLASSDAVKDVIANGRTVRGASSTLPLAARGLAEKLCAHALLITPLVARDRAIGAISCALVASDRQYTEEDQLLAEEVAAHIALAMENAMLFQKAQEAVQARDGLLAVVSHDLRGPLDVVSLALSLLEGGATEAQLGLLARARRGVERMTRLIEDLLDIARIDAGTLTIIPAPVPVFELLEEVYELHRPLAAAKKIELVRETRGAPRTLALDRHRMTQAISNLLGNALKFTPPGGTVRLAVDAREDAVTIQVSDSGPGIPRADLPRVFDRFWQRERNSKGVGLGLAIVKGIIDAHGGTISVESAEGAGATFCLRLSEHASP
jgi:signal transduction histidine kinase